MFPAVKMSNGYSYHLQELAFLSWFYNAQGDPSIGAGGKFSDHATFKGPFEGLPSWGNVLISAKNGAGLPAPGKAG
jgi:hypothetical protein